jgi:hypothetical protein
MMGHGKIRAVVIPLALALCVGSIWWQQTSAIATILLLYATFEYVMANQENVALFRKQLERQEKVFIRFGLRSAGGNIYIWAANLGLSSFLISSIRVRKPTNHDATIHKINSIVPTGTLKNDIPFPIDIWGGRIAPFSVPLDVSITCEGIGEKHQTEWRAFTINFSLAHILTVYAGFRDIYAVECPKCRLSDLMLMEIDDLDDLDEVWQREKETRQELERSCPDHKSQYLLKYDPNAPVKKLTPEQ